MHDPISYASLLVMLTLLTGILYVPAGAGRLGFMAKFLSQPILTGYLNGIALLIIVDQLPKLFGYSASSLDFIGKLLELVTHFHLSHWPTAIIGLGLLALPVALMRFLPRLPRGLPCGCGEHCRRAGAGAG